MGGLEYKLDDDLLSHGETPHYHRRCIVSLLSSGWDQVVPMLYGRQAIRVERRGEAQLQIGYVISGYFAVLADFRLLQSLRLAHKQQIVWVLYGQASRAISTG